MEVSFVGRVRAGAKDGREVAAGGHTKSVDEIARPPGVLLLHKNAAAVGQHEGGDVDRVSFGVFVSQLKLFEGAPVTVFDGRCRECAA